MREGFLLRGVVISLLLHIAVFATVFAFNSKKLVHSDTQPAQSTMNFVEFELFGEEVVEEEIIEEEIIEEVIEEEIIEKEVVEEIIEQEVVQESIQEVQKVQEVKKPIQKPKKTKQKKPKPMPVPLQQDAPIELENSIKEQTQEFIQTNFTIIRTMVMSQVRYPSMAQRMRHEGVVEVTLVISKKGHLKDYYVSKSSKSKLLDDAAMSAVQRIQRSEFPKPPRQTQVVLPIAFNIR